MDPMLLLVTGAGNGNTIKWNAPGFGWVALVGVFDGATVTLQASPDGGTTWIAVSTEAVFTSDAWHAVRLPKGTPLRFNITGGGGSVSINVYVS